MHLKIVSFIGAITAVPEFNTSVISWTLYKSYSKGDEHPPWPMTKDTSTIGFSPNKGGSNFMLKKNLGYFFQPNSMFADVSLEINGCICYSI